MRNNLILIIAILTCLNTLSSAQNNKISTVSFDYWHSLRMPNNHVTVDFESARDSVKVMVKSVPHNIDTTTLTPKQKKRMGQVKQYETRAYSFNISESEFEKVIASIRQISCTDVFNLIIAGDGGIDGTSCAISFGNYQSTMSYKVWSPQSDTKRRSLENYIAACEVILTTAKLNPKEILGD